MSDHAPPYSDMGYPAPQHTPAPMQSMRAMGLMGPNLSQQPNQRRFKMAKGVGRWQTVAAPTASWGEDAPHLAMGRVPCDLHQL